MRGLEKLCGEGTYIYINRHRDLLNNSAKKAQLVKITLFTMQQSKCSPSHVWCVNPRARKYQLAGLPNLTLLTSTVGAHCRATNSPGPHLNLPHPLFNHCPWPWARSQLYHRIHTEAPGYTAVLMGSCPNAGILANPLLRSGLDCIFTHMQTSLNVALI